MPQPLPQPPKKVLLYSPPGGLWLRGEARCEQDLENATAYTVTAPTTLCYMAAIFRQQNITVKIIDCPVEKVSRDEFAGIIREYAPDVAILNASVLNLPIDLETVKQIHDLNPAIQQCLILPYFKIIPLAEISYKDFQLVDFLFIGEMEAVAYDFAEFLSGQRSAEKIRGVIANDKTAQALTKHDPIPPIADLDALPRPARDLIKNELYLRPDVGRPLATIVDGRGCPSNCIYCLASITTGKKVRKRSPDSVVAEIKECLEKFQIRDFLFRSDCFTIKKDWVLEFCRKINEANLDISWAANSITACFDEQIAAAMRKAGCFLVEFGIESGSDRSLKLQKKGTTTAQALSAVKAARKAGLLTYGTVLIGLPWEKLSDIRETERFIMKLNLDFIELHIVGPFRGTELYDLMMSHGLIESDSIGFDMVKNPASKGTLHVSKEQLLDARKRILRRFYFRPLYMFRTLRRLTSVTQFLQYAKYGSKLLLRLIKGNAH